MEVYGSLAWLALRMARRGLEMNRKTKNVWQWDTDTQEQLKKIKWPELIWLRLSLHNRI